MTALLRWAGRAVEPVPVRVNWGRWVADCPACSSALAIDEHLQTQLGAVRRDRDGRVLGYVDGCWDCGARADLAWPAEDFVHGVERLLAMRPQEQTRNWVPGETLHDLVRENALHGLFSAPELDGLLDAPGELLVVTDGGIALDRLPVLERAAPARQIGA